MKRLTLLFLSSILLLLTLQYCSKSDPAPDVSTAVPEYPDVKSYFSAAYVAQESFEDKGKATTITDGKPVRVIKDIIGDKDLVWAGAEVPSPMWQTPPVFHVDENTGGPKPTGYILVHNVTDTYWQSAQFAAVAQPYDMYVVLRDLDAVNYEGYFARSLGLRNRGDHLELSISGPNTPTTKKFDMSTPTILEFSKISIVRIRFDGANTKLWINNKEVAPGAVDIGSGKINQIVYGTNSHAAQHDFYGMWVKLAGTLSDTQSGEVYQALSSFYNPGKYPTMPLATKITAVWNNTSKAWEAKYTYVGDNPEDLTKTEFQWGYHDQNLDLNTSTFFQGDKSKGKTLLRSDFSAQIPNPGNGKVRVFVIVKVYDSKGNSWSHLVRSAFTIDNVL